MRENAKLEIHNAFLRKTSDLDKRTWGFMSYNKWARTYDATWSEVEQRTILTLRPITTMMRSKMNER